MDTRRKALALVAAAVSLLVVLVPLTAGAEVLLFSDAYDRADGSLGSPWATANSTWGVRSTRARLLTGQYASTTAVASVPLAATTSVYVSADITLSPTSLRANAGLTPAFVDYRNNIFCKLEVTDGNPNGLIAIGRRLNGTITSQLSAIQNAGLVNGGTYHVACARSGFTITMTVGSRTITYTMSSTDRAAFGTTTKVGLRTHIASNEDDGGSLYDNFTVSDVAPAPSPSPSPSPDPSPSPSPDPSPSPSPDPSPSPSPVVRLAAVGDICGDTAQARANCEATGDLVVSEDPDIVAVLGDLAYPDGRSVDFTYYDARWGAGNSPSFLDITRPVPGNHEYNDPTSGPGAEGYRAEFPDAYAPPTGRLYYSYNLGNWHVVALDTDNCQSGEGCPRINTVNSTQVRWMIADLAADTHTCDIAYGHHPAYSSPDGPTSNRHGSISWMQPAWDQMVAAGVDIYLAGHDHDYERFAPMNANGAAVAVGTRQFVLGTGGAALDTFDTILSTSEFHYTGLGVTIFTLGEDWYSWELVSTTGTTIDQGGPVACH